MLGNLVRKPDVYKGLCEGEEDILNPRGEQVGVLSSCLNNCVHPTRKPPRLKVKNALIFWYCIIKMYRRPL